jgi:hypothetical protein
MHRPIATGIFAALFCACSPGSSQLQGAWIGSRAEGIRADQQAQASSFVKSLRLVFDRDTVTVTQGGISNTGRYKLHHEDTASIVIYSGEGELEPQTFTFAADKQLRWAMSDDRSILFTPSGR